MLDIKSLRKDISDIIQLNEGLTRKEMLMEMPATNYTTFDTLPYIICDAEYYEDEDGNVDYDAGAYVPLEEFIDNKNKYVLPSWLRYNREAMMMPEMNKTLDLRFLCIVAYAGYYDGMTVGIEVRDSDELFAEEFYQSEDEEGNVYWDSDLSNNRLYSEEECHKILDKLYEHQLEEARGIIVKYHQNYGGRLYPSDFKLSEPEDDGSELNENVSGDEYEEWDGDGTEIIGVGETKKYIYKGYKIYVSASYDEYDENGDDLIVFYASVSLPDGTERMFSDEGWLDLCYSVTNFINKLVDGNDYIEPESDGSELNETVNERFEKWNGSDTDIIGTDEKVNYEYKGYQIYTSASVASYVMDGEDIVVYYADILNGEDFGESLSDMNWMDLCHRVTKWIDEHPINETEPEWNGELDESVNSSDDWMDNELNDGETALYNYYGYDLEIRKLSKEFDVKIFEKDTGDIAEWEYFKNWDDLVKFVKGYIDKREGTEPETDGDELNESEENSSWERYAPPVGSGVKFKIGLSTFEALCSRDDGFRSYYKLRIFDDDNEKDYTEITFNDWNHLVRNAKRYARYPEADPEESGEEYMESLNESWLPGAEWLDEPIDIGYSKTYFYKGYDFAIEGIRDSDGDYYSLRIYIHDIADDDDALVQEASFDTWDELAIYVRDYVDENPLKKEEIKEPEDTGDEYMESKLDIKNIKKKINEIVEQANG